MFQRIFSIFEFSFIFIFSLIYISFIIREGLNYNFSVISKTNDEITKKIIRLLIIYFILVFISIPIIYKITEYYIDYNITKYKIIYSESNKEILYGKIIENPKIVKIKGKVYYDVLVYSRGKMEYLLIPKNLKEIKKNKTYKIERYKYYVANIK